MTAAQKTAKLKFKQAIAYRQKTGVSLKEAFAHIYGRKVGAVKTTYGVYVYGSLVYETNDILIANAYAETYKKRGQNAIVKKIPKNKVGAVKKKAAPKKKAAKKVVKKSAPKKVVRKVVKKKAAPKKVAKKKLTPRDYDMRYSAKKPGKRTSADGNTYYESRPNRSDKGKLLGIGNVLNKNQEIKRLSQLAKTPLEKRIVSMIKYKLTGYDNLESLLKDILYSGLQSGIVSDLIYYSDTLAFYKRYKKEIDILLKDLINETGSNSPADLFGNKWDKEDFFIEDTNNRNLLAWFGFEEKLRELTNKLGYEI